MIKINNKQKALMLSFVLAALLLPTTLRAQAYDKEAAESYNGGAFYELIAYDTYLDELANVLKAVELNRGSASISGGSITNDDFGPSPLGSGLGILIAAGAGYAALRRKRSRRNTTLLLACVVLLGFTQCKKEQIEPQGNGVNITLNVQNGASTGSATDGAKVNVDPYNSPMVTFGSGDQILVVSNGHYVGTLTHNGSNFSGEITDPTVGQPLYFYFLGNKQGSLSVGADGCTVNISDQTNYPHLPVISMGVSIDRANGNATVNYDSGTSTYEAQLHNKASLMKFSVTSPSTRPICITGMKNKVTIDFTKAASELVLDNNGFSYSVDETDGGLIMLRGGSGSPAEKWAIVLPQAALSAGGDGSVYTNEETQRYKANRPALDAISSNQYLSSGVALTLTEDNSTTVDLSKLVHHYRANDGETLTGTLADNYKISIASGATVTLNGVTINGVHNYSYNWAGLSCIGDATIVLADGTTNTVKGFRNTYPGIHIPNGNTLTIQGETAVTGTLNATSNGDGAGIGGGFDIDCGNILIKSGIINATGGGSYAAGIGCGYYTNHCGNIVIQGGTVTAIAGNMAAGIGSSMKCSCGNIEIQGGTVVATGGSYAAGIGTGYGQDGEDGHYEMVWDDELQCEVEGAWIEGTPAEPSYCGTITISGGTIDATGGFMGAGIGTGEIGNCGNITITDGVTRVTATKGTYADHSIGTGSNGYHFSQNSYTVTIGGVEGKVSTSPYTYQP